MTIKLVRRVVTQKLKSGHAAHTQYWRSGERLGLRRDISGEHQILPDYRVP